MTEPATDGLRRGEMTSAVQREPKTVFDFRVMLWFFSWLGGLWLCSGGFVLVVFASPFVMKYVDRHPLIIPAIVLTGAICVVFALHPELTIQSRERNYQRMGHLLAMLAFMVANPKAGR